MRHVAVCFVFIVAWGLIGGPTALAQDDSGRTEEIVVTGGMDPRSAARDWLIIPKGDTTVGGTLRFMTAEGGLGTGEIGFTDVVLLDLNGRFSLGGRAELFAGLTLLPKQPSDTGEVIWQGTTLGARYGFAERFAGSLRASVGPTLGHTGNWATLDVAVESRKSLHETLRLQGSLGGSGTAVLLEGTPEPRFGFGEVVADGQIIFGAPGGEVALWIGTQFRFPVVKVANAAAEPFDPQTRVNFRVGGVLSYIEDWDIYAEFYVNDRGELDAPATVLPILDGGFDQTFLVLGLTRRFRGDEGRRR